MPESLLVAVLAAGASRRLGRPKQLVPVGGEPLLRRQCRVAIEADVGPVLVVLGHQANACATLISDLPVEIRVNEGWEEGLASSIRVAAQAAADSGAAGLLILHGDQFRITAGDLRALHRAWQAAGGQAACRSVDGAAGYAGPPVVLPARSFDATLRLRGDEGARAVLDVLKSERSLVDVEIPNARHDLDLPSHLLELQ
jgi:molybdenum cofactor cytidylyltransferase